MRPIRKNWLEWTVFGLGLALVLVTLGYLAVAAITTSDTPPQLVVRTGKPVATSHGYVVPVVVRNDGGTTAENVVVEVVLEGGGESEGGEGGDGGITTERAELTLPYVPRHAQREGWVSFRQDPSRATRVVARPAGYVVP